MEEDIYFQLNTLKVKTIPSEQLRYDDYIIPFDYTIIMLAK